VKAVLWILGSILVLDVLLVAVFAACAAVVRRRAARAVADVDSVSGPTPSDPPRLIAVPDDADDPPILPARGAMAPDADEGRRSRSGGHRVAGVALVAAMIVAGSAVASPDVRRFVATAIDAVSSGLGSTNGEPLDVAGPGADPGTVPDGTTSPTASAPTRGDPGGRPRPGPSPGPTVDPRSPGEPHGILPPAAPTSVSARATGSSGEIEVSWADNVGETGYRVERSAAGPAGPWETVARPVQDATSFSDRGLSAATTYYYRVFARDGEVESPPSNVVSATTPLDAPSATVLRVVATTANRVELEWDDVTTEAGYRIERSLDPSGPWDVVATHGQDVTAATDLDVGAATTYWYRVVAYNDAGDSPASETVSATTSEAGPEEPGGEVESG
jgi:hypothetical protein